MPDSCTFPGGRTAALQKLTSYDPLEYGRTRNFLDAPVSRLSPYLRHGMLTIHEVREYWQKAFADRLPAIEELIRQLAWRDFFEKVLEWHGDGLNHDLEAPKHHVARSQDLPADIASGQTQLPCIDGMLTALFETGYLHNHERLWFAAYLCHYRGVSWTVGAQLFRRFLLDGDLASNSCSWQWVESTFASKPYFMNRENIARFSNNRWCESCTATCPFDATYETLQHRLFDGNHAPFANNNQPAERPRVSLPVIDPEIELPVSTPAIVWVHDAAMSAIDPAILANPEALLVWIWDESMLIAEPWAEHRIQFVRDGWADLKSTVPNRQTIEIMGQPVDELRRFARAVGTTSIHLSDHPSPVVRATILKLKRDLDVTIHSRPEFATYESEPMRFSRYWEKVAPMVLGYRPVSSKKRMR